MKDISRIIRTSFWNDNKVSELFTPEDRYFMLYLLTNPHTTQLGIYEFSIKVSAFEMGYSQETIIGLLDRFENTYGVIKYSKETKEIAIKNYLRHSIIKGGKPVFDCLVKEEQGVKDKSLVSYIVKYISTKDDINETVLEFVRYIIGNEKENEKETDNDNDNERIVPRIVPRIVKESSEKSKEPKIAFGEYQNVKLTQTEYDRLAKDLTETLRDSCIKFLDEYIEEKGYKSKSHNLAIRRWVVDAVKEKDSKGKPKVKETSFHQFDMKHNYDFDVMEKELLRND